MSFPNRMRRILIPVLAVMSGILIFAASAAASLDAAIFNSSFHLSLIEKYGIYNELQKVAGNALDNYLAKAASGPEDDDIRAGQLFSLAGEAVTPDMIRLNIDALVEGLMKYFSGEVRFLPDIYIKPAGANTGIKPQADLVQASLASDKPLAGIDRISLNVVLMYMDRNDIINTFSDVRLIGFAFSYAPGFLLLFSLLLLVPAVMLAKGRQIRSFLFQAAATAGILGIASGCTSLVLSSLYLPGYLSSSPLTGYIQYDSLYGYAKSFIQRPALIIAAIGSALLTAAFLIRLLPRFTYLTVPHRPASMPATTKSPIAGFFSKHGKSLTCAVLVLLSTVALVVRAEAMKNEFHSKDLGAALDRLRGAGAHSTVIAARDETVYSVEVRTFDLQSGAPVQGLHILLNGELSDNGDAYSVSGPSDETGKARFDLLKGSFTLEFDPSQFPQDYILPASYPFEIKNPGTTVITVNLEKSKEDKTGIAEILVLGADNKPLENLELAAEGYPQEGGETTDSGKVYSFTNQDGTAVFKLAEGRYRVSFIDGSFPEQYLVPEPIYIEVSGDGTASYSLKLAKEMP